MSVLDEPTTKADVVAAYRLFHGRNPESMEVVEGHAGCHKTIGKLREAFLSSSEFRSHVETVPYFLNDKWVMTETLHGLKMWVNLRDNVVSRGVLDDAWEPGVTQLILGKLRKGDAFVDIGANIGWFAVQAANRLRELGGGKVYAFEPRSDLFAMASRSVAENGLQDFVELHHAGLADKPGEMELYWFARNENAAASALATGGVPAGAEHESVRLVRLDDIAIREPVRLIKCDAEGAEGLVFAGAAALLEKHRPEIIAELNIAGLPAVSGVTADAWLAAMSSAGYRRRLVEDSGAVGREIVHAADAGDPAANLLFIPIAG